MPTITKRDRDALLRVVKERFELLEREVARRETILRNQITKEIEAENKEKLDSYREQANELLKQERELRDRMSELRVKAHGDNVTLVTYHGSMESFEVRVENLPTIVHDRLHQMKVDAGIANGSLFEMKLDLTERLLVMGLETQEAAAFMAEIPKIDNLLPLPELTEGEVRDDET